LYVKRALVFDIDHYSKAHRRHHSGAYLVASLFSLESAGGLDRSKSLESPLSGVVARNRSKLEPLQSIAIAAYSRIASVKTLYAMSSDYGSAIS
jgi:hypothetical protein